jgi:hypothetical protein
LANYWNGQASVAAVALVLLARRAAETLVGGPAEAPGLASLRQRTDRFALLGMAARRRRGRRRDFTHRSAPPRPSWS